MYQKNSNGIVTLAVPGAILKEECFDPLKSKIGGNPVIFNSHSVSLILLTKKALWKNTSNFSDITHKCKLCGKDMSFLLQIYAPTEVIDFLKY